MESKIRLPQVLGNLILYMKKKKKFFKLTLWPKVTFSKISRILGPIFFFISAHFYWISREYSKFDRLKRKKRHFLNFKIRKKNKKVKF